MKINNFLNTLSIAAAAALVMLSVSAPQAQELPKAEHSRSQCFVDAYIFDSSSDGDGPFSQRIKNACIPDQSFTHSRTLSEICMEFGRDVSKYFRQIRTMQKNMMAKCPVNTREPDCPQMRSKFNEDIQLYQNESNYIERQCGVRVDYVNLQYTRLEQF